MEARDIYNKMKAIAEPHHAYTDQFVAISKWIEAEFTYNPHKASVPKTAKTANIFKSMEAVEYVHVSDSDDDTSKLVHTLKPDEKSIKFLINNLVGYLEEMEYMDNINFDNMSTEDIKILYHALFSMNVSIAKISNKIK